MENKNCEQYVIGRVEYLESKNHDLREENHRLKMQVDEQSATISKLRDRISRLKSICDKIIDFSGTGKCIRFSNVYAWGDDADGYTEDDFKFLKRFFGLKVHEEPVVAAEPEVVEESEELVETDQEQNTEKETEE